MPHLFSRSAAPRAKLVRRADAAAAAAAAPWGTAREHDESSLASASASASASAYEVLLGGNDRSSMRAHQQPSSNHNHGRRHHHHHHHHYNTTASAQRGLQRAWLAAADARRPSWTGERPPPRKLVKEQGASARPLAAQELLEHDDSDKDGGRGKRQQNGNGESEGLAGVDDEARRVAAGNGSKDAEQPGPGSSRNKSIRRKMARWRELHW
ncbi:hypothetical protein SPI_04464 [Niveomyces insectorum RCEF 264]|uniref:Uncharacterized protein n=1 Tax=Niveomyces insectorum RCEF 264 TaxID=1081102 RepID=A0A167UIE1_9HYPO|nr:hypothetical protein SPI_04464 [Niveomyces insectorum RCEF 264]